MGEETKTPTTAALLEDYWPSASHIRGIIADAVLACSGADTKQWVLVPMRKEADRG